MPPLRPFPFPSLNVGTDIVSVPRILALIQPTPTTSPSNDRLDSFLRHTLTPRETKHFRSRYGLQSPESRDSQHWNGIATFLAGRWAAKEAVVKACHWRRLTLGDVQILQQPGGEGRIYGVILDRVAELRESKGKEEMLEEQEAGQVVRISISHEKEFATAVCIAASEEGREGDVGGEAAAREPI